MTICTKIREVVAGGTTAAKSKNNNSHGDLLVEGPQGDIGVPFEGMYIELGNWMTSVKKNSRYKEAVPVGFKLNYQRVLVWNGINTQK